MSQNQKMCQMLLDTKSCDHLKMSVCCMMQRRLYADDVGIYFSLVDGHIENDDDGHLLC